MQTIPLGISKEKASLYKWASALALVTIIYNILEGLLSVSFGHSHFDLFFTFKDAQKNVDNADVNVMSIILIAKGEKFYETAHIYFCCQCMAAVLI
jgi:hypothetical protein